VIAFFGIIAASVAQISIGPAIERQTELAYVTQPSLGTTTVGVQNGGGGSNQQGCGCCSTAPGDSNEKDVRESIDKLPPLPKECVLVEGDADNARILHYLYDEGEHSLLRKCLISGSAPAICPSVVPKVKNKCKDIKDFATKLICIKKEIQSGLKDSGQV